MNPFLLASDHETRVFIFLNTTGHMNATVLVLNSFSLLRGRMLRETDGVT